MAVGVYEDISGNPCTRSRIDGYPLFKVDSKILPASFEYLVLPELTSSMLVRYDTWQYGDVVCSWAITTRRFKFKSRQCCTLLRDEHFLLKIKLLFL